MRNILFILLILLIGCNPLNKTTRTYCNWDEVNRNINTLHSIQNRLKRCNGNPDSITVYKKRMKSRYIQYIPYKDNSTLINGVYILDDGRVINKSTVDSQYIEMEKQASLVYDAL